MADYFTQFSCTLHVGSAENAAAAQLIRDELAAEIDRDDAATLGFEMEARHDSGAAVLWIYSDGSGDPEHVIRFVLRCADTL